MAVVGPAALPEGAGVIAGASGHGGHTGGCGSGRVTPLSTRKQKRKGSRSTAPATAKRVADFGLSADAPLLERIVPLLSKDFRRWRPTYRVLVIPQFLSAPATTENVGRIFHEFVAAIGAPLHVVAHDFGAWVAYSWALLFRADFKSLTLIDAGIPGITLTEDVQLSDYKRKWNFIFQMLPDLPAQLTTGKEDIYVGWWFKNKVYKSGAIPPHDVAAYVRAYARKGRMDAAFDYCRQILATWNSTKATLELSADSPACGRRRARDPEHGRVACAIF